jgi:tricorn protease
VRINMKALPIFLAAASLSMSAEAPLLLQKPTINRSHIVFNYAGDLWTVPRGGGDAIRLTSAPGVETDPVFSPDGQTIAFTGEYDGNVDVFTVPATGGVPKRLTWHPAPDQALHWTPDGKQVLFSSPRTAYSRFNELFTVPASGGFETKLPLPSGVEGAFSPDGKSIAYLPTERRFQVWKRYRGGTTTKIWIADLATSRIQRVPRANSNDFNPMWIGDKLFFLSDRNGPFTLYSYDTKSKAVKEVLPNAALDLKSASGASDAIVYEQFGGIHLLDLKSGSSKQVQIRVAGDFPELRPRLVNVGKSLGSPAISPNGARALFTARGEVITVPAEKGDPRVITNTPGVMEREPQWSPDARTIAYFSDESGEYALHLKPQVGAGEVTRIPLDSKAFPSGLRWSPDSKKIAFFDNKLVLWYVDLETKKPIRVDRNTYWPAFEMLPTWSPDSKWIAYTKRLKNYFGAIHLYSIADAKATQITDGMSDARHPVFDKDGKYLYFTASTDAGESLQPDVHSTTRSSTRSVYMVVLDSKDPSPFAPESDEEKIAEDRKVEAPAVAGAKPDGMPDPAKPKPPAPVTTVQVDLTGIDQRVLAMPMPPRSYVGLQVGRAGTLLALEAPQTQPGAPPEAAGLNVHRYDLKARKGDMPMGGVRAFVMAHSGEKALYRQGDNWSIAPLRPMQQGPGPAPPAPPPSGSSASNLKVENIEVRVVPQEEWKQMYREAWRIERDFFYDPGLHGLDLQAASKRYEPYLASIASRRDLTYLFQEMLGEMTVGHLGTGGGDLPEVKRIATGLLGCDYEIAEGRYRLARVYSGENWNPQLRAPLTQPGVNVKAGEYLLAVNGRDVTPAENVHGFFEGMANKAVVLKVGPSADGVGAREVTVVPLATESALRNLAWIEANRRKVDTLTGGKVAYIYMPDTANGGIAAFKRYFYAQVGKEGAIIDERFNAGGLLATDIAEILNRKLLSAVATRDGEDEIQPQGAIFGPKVMIINETAGSGGDAMPWYFRRAGVGKLVGTRTWGGLVGRANSPQLMDGGIVTAPGSGVYNPHSGEWEVENVGVAPDVEVEQDPELVRQGRDPQLERAVQLVLEELKKNPPTKLRRPTYPNYHTKRPLKAGG